jgi:hypothetical protein
MAIQKTKKNSKSLKTKKLKLNKQYGGANAKPLGLGTFARRRIKPGTRSVKKQSINNITKHKFINMDLDQLRKELNDKAIEQFSLVMKQEYLLKSNKSNSLLINEIEKELRQNRLEIKIIKELIAEKQQQQQLTFNNFTYENMRNAHVPPFQEPVPGKEEVLTTSEINKIYENVFEGIYGNTKANVPQLTREPFYVNLQEISLEPTESLYTPMSLQTSKDFSDSASNSGVSSLGYEEEEQLPAIPSNPKSQKNLKSGPIINMNSIYNSTA